MSVVTEPTAVQRGAVRNIVLGLVAGDALAWISAEHRLQRLPERRVKHFRWLQGYTDDTRTTTRPVPNVHSSPVGVLRPGPADDTEWFVFSATAMAQHVAGDAGAITRAWTDLAPRAGELRARSGTHRALGNLHRGMTPPESGHDNPHYFDDIAAVRAVAAGILAAGDEQLALELAQADAEITHSLDGLWCARATARLITGLVGRSDTATVIAAAREELPEGGWSARTVDRALELADSSTSAVDLAMTLDRLVVDKIYSYPVAAPETLALLLAHLSRASSADELMLGAFAQARNADALPALAGAVAAARYGGAWLPRELVEGPVVLDGVSIPWFEGTDVEATVTLLERPPERP